MMKFEDFAPLGSVSNWKLARKWSQLPDEVGVYVVFEEETGTVVYVGSGNVKHRGYFWLRKRGMVVKWRGPRQVGEHLMAEFKLIKRLQPPGNERGVYKVRKPLACRLTKNQLEEIKRGKAKKVDELMVAELAEKKMRELGLDLPSPPRVKSDGWLERRRDDLRRQS